jgi:hypothetical protein
MQQSNRSGRLYPPYDVWGLSILLVLSVVGLGPWSMSEAQTAPASASPPQHFATAEAAAQAFLDACKNDNSAALLTIFGPDHTDLIVTADTQADREDRKALYDAAQQALHWESAGETKRILVIGAEQWPFPIPLIRDATGWYFNTEAGADEILNRRIGRNELEAIAMLQALVDTQGVYASQDRDGDEVLEYAQRILSSANHKDGLFWPTEDGTQEVSPLGPYLNEFSDYVQGKTQGDPWYGYYFKVLLQQGPHPSGGRYDYVINGNMIGGFAFVAMPATYGTSGIMTFIVNHQGKIYEKDLGKETAAIVEVMREYDPDATWRPVKSAE